MVCGRRAFALIQFVQHPLPTPIATSLGSLVLLVTVHLFMAEYLFVRRKVTTRILADEAGAFSLILQHV
jgi:hypothetical protein